MVSAVYKNCGSLNMKYLSRKLLVCNMIDRVEAGLGHPGQADLTWFIKYMGLTRILHWITCIDNGI